MTAQIKQDEVNKAVWEACDTFRGTVDGSVYKDYVLTMLFLKYISDVWQDHYDKYKDEYDDEPELIHEMLKSERFVLPETANFYELYKHRHKAGNGERIDKALHAIEEANIAKLRDVFQDISFNSNKLGEEAQKNEFLKDLLEDFAKDNLNLAPSRIGKLDIIGNAYEFLIKQFAADSGRKAGEFYTPPEVSELMADLVAPKEGDEICDPTCGSGSLLMKCGQRIQIENEGSKKYALFGQEAIGSTWALAKMNMFLHGEDNHRIEWGDTIRNPKLLNSQDSLKHFDIVVTPPPFSLEKWGHGTAEADKFSRLRRGIPPKTKGDYAFILHMIETMKPKSGRMAVVAPHGVLFRGSSEGKIRQKLFYGTGIPAAILVFKKEKSDKNTLFIDASCEFTSGKNQNQLSAANIEKIVETYQNRESVDKYAYLATPEEMAENDFNLNIPRYVDSFEEEEEIDLMAVREERTKLKAELAELEEKMDGYLKELGYIA
ncbi:MAG: type I restriction-modification system subunit M [Cohaesibacter sp.]|nr:type I restriction-modification system subunit M [Cohaesibacter sp.]